LNADQLGLLSAVASGLGEAIERTRFRKLAEEAAVMIERQRLARELHDSVSQSLYALNLFVRSSINALEDGARQDLADSLVEVETNAHQALREMRLLLYELRPTILDREGLAQALSLRLDAVEKRAGIQYTFLIRGDREFPQTLESDLYRIAIEALNNALKHSGARRVWVLIDHTPERIKLSIRDNGRGFLVDQVGREGMGLRTMRERGEKIGGALRVQSWPGLGAQVRLTVIKNRSTLGVQEGLP
jgi:signal transduction histidine kinase